MANRDEYVEKMKAQLDDWNEEIGKLEEKLSAASEATREKLEPHLEKVSEAREAVFKNIAELK